MTTFDGLGPRKPDAVTAIVLCGGRGSRLGGIDKPLLEVAGRPLLGHLIEWLRPQVDDVVLACARRRTDCERAGAHEIADYERFGYKVVADLEADEGPLAGIVSAAPAIATPLALTIPGDMPFPPPNLVAAMKPDCLRHGAAVATAGGRRQNLTLLLQRQCLDSLCAFFADGGRAAHRWLDANGIPSVPFAAAHFLNVNTAADLQRARSQCQALARRQMDAS